MDIQKISSKVAGDFIAKLPEELKKHQFTKEDNPNPKGNDRDGDGKTNEKKPFKEKESSEAPKGVVAALTFDGEVKLFEASGPEAAKGIKAALQKQQGEYARIAVGPNPEGLTASELYEQFEQRWAGCEKLPEGPMRDNCEKKKKEKGDEKED